MLSGCMPQAQSCVSWAGYDSVDAVFADSELVVRGTVTPTKKTTQLLGYDAAVHTVAVRQVLKGDASAGTALPVASTPITCSGDKVYPEGDPLDVSGEVVLFLTSDESGVWRTLTPFEGVHRDPQL